MDDSNPSASSSGSIFDKDSAVSQSASGIVRLLVLQRLDDALRAWEFSLNYDGKGAGIHGSVRCKSAIMSLLALLKPRIKQRASLKKYKDGKEVYPFNLDKISTLLKEDNFSDLIDLILEYLESDLKLTKIDTNKEYDRTNAENENEMKSL